MILTLFCAYNHNNYPTKILGTQGQGRFTAAEDDPASKAVTCEHEVCEFGSLNGRSTSALASPLSVAHRFLKTVYAVDFLFKEIKS